MKRTITASEDANSSIPNLSIFPLQKIFPLRRISVDEYHKIGEDGIIKDDEHIELIEGVIVEMSPKGTKHTTSVSKLTNLLPRLLEGKAWIRVQDPVVLDDLTEPEPDIAVVEVHDDDYSDAHPHPDDICLLIEASDTTLEKDKKIKLPIYAASGIPEVWIVNLIEDIVEVYREPISLPDGSTGYRTRTNFVKGDTIAPQAFPDKMIDVSKIMV